MESKQINLLKMKRNGRSLLIEPVWNRNVSCGSITTPFSPFNRTSMESKPAYFLKTHELVSPFNRTSMESKHLSSAALCDLSRATFNRTSMESKLSRSYNFSSILSLLIEPVWNRNLIDGGGVGTPTILLIEPVWNRNLIISAVRKIGYRLLIEPVWNRNVCCSRSDV